MAQTRGNPVTPQAFYLYNDPAAVKGHWQMELFVQRLFLFLIINISRIEYKISKAVQYIWPSRTDVIKTLF